MAKGSCFVRLRQKARLDLPPKKPRGDFHLSEQHDKLLLLSAGSGITSMLSMVNYLSENNQLQDVVFYHQCSKKHDIPQRAQLEQLAKQHPTLQVHIALTKPEQYWQGLTGRFDQQHLKVIQELNDRQVFVCGPQAFMESAKNQLIKNGLPPLQYHQEAFGMAKADVGEYKDVYITVDDKDIPATNQNTLLEHLTNNGIKIKSSCRAGVCGACKVTLQDGEVVQMSTSALSEEERAAGVVLACCCTPITDVVVLTGERHTPVAE
jgi:ferredoxin-NADP reductase